MKNQNKKKVSHESQHIYGWPIIHEYSSKIPLPGEAIESYKAQKPRSKNVHKKNN